MDFEKINKSKLYHFIDGKMSFDFNELNYKQHILDKIEDHQFNIGTNKRIIRELETNNKLQELYIKVLEDELQKINESTN